MNQVSKPHPMQQFHDMLQLILDTGVRRPNRTGHDTLFIDGHMLKFDLADGFPAITTKKLAFRSAVGELIGFFRGFDNAAQFREIGCKVWDQNANETPAWLANPHRKGTDDLGRIYGKQWTDWRDYRVVHSFKEADDLAAKGYERIAYDASNKTWVFRRGINQLETMLHTIMTASTDRRILLTGWRPDEFDQMALPPCHLDYQFLCDVENKRLSLAFFQRSFDSALAFNIAIGALMLSIMAKLTGYNCGNVTQFIGDAHIYLDHIPGVKEMLSRDHFAQPTLLLGESIPTLTSVDQIPGVFTRIEPADIQLENYQHHPAIKFAMAA